jgi:hypothetical protein
MTGTDHPRDLQLLPADEARRLLTRATELEATRSADLTVAELRQAAREAGISPAAFEQALAELDTQDVPSARNRGPSRQWRVPWYIPAALILVPLLGIFLVRLLVPGT